MAAGLDPVEHLDAADLDHPVAARRVEPGGFGVENDFPHGPLSPVGEAETSEDRVHLGAGLVEAARGVDDEVGARALLGVGHLAREDLRRVSPRSSRAAPAPARAALGRRGNDDHLVESGLAAGFEQQGDVEQQGRAHRHVRR